jgi:sugar-specific transcriptional regulator TrmB
VGAAACSDDPGGSAGTTSTSERVTTTSTAPEREPSTTTTAFDPETAEGAVEAAYLRSWDVYADAVYDLVLDEEALSEVYAEEGLTNVIEEVTSRIDDSRAAFVLVEHDYQVTFTNESLASVVDRITNHQVLIDPVTKEPSEEDPNERQLLNFVMKRIDGDWFVTLIQRIDA